VDEYDAVAGQIQPVETRVGESLSVFAESGVDNEARVE
jgi:hypothetical protein